jgi:WD40 repeat protein
MCDQDRLAELVQDARRFIMYHKGAIEGYPLQTYASALLFSPTGSLVRQLFKHEEPEAISIRPTLTEEWSACLQTLEGHSNAVRSVVFSHDSTRLASASDDNTVKMWDASTGACLQTLEGHSDWVRSVVFSHDSTRLASASGDNTVKMWDASSGACVQTLEGHSDDVNTVKMWDASTGACLQTLDVGKVLFHLSFDRNNSRLLTEIGSIDTQGLETFSITDLKELARPLHVGTGFSSDLVWIQHAGNNMLWVPSEYRPSHSSVSGTMVGVGVGSGRVWICSIDL